jgi:hypothetical protein
MNPVGSATPQSNQASGSPDADDVDCSSPPDVTGILFIVPLTGAPLDSILRTGEMHPASPVPMDSVYRRPSHI